VLATVPMAASTGGHIDPGPGGLAGAPLVGISADLPATGIESIQVANNGRVVATETRPARPPAVRVLAPGRREGRRTEKVLVRWSARDPGNHPLAVAIEYSANGGPTWRTVFVCPNIGHISLPSSYFTASRDARIRIRASEPFELVDALSARFTVLGAPPH